MMNKPIVVFCAICVASIATLAGYLFHAKNRLPVAPAKATAASVSPQPIAPKSALSPSGGDVSLIPSNAPLPEQTQSQRIFFRHNGVDSHYGSLAHVDSANAADLKFVDSLRCEVVHVSGGRGICLTADRGVFTTYAALLFDAKTFDVVANIPLKGIPSRSRVSIDGKLAAFTVFVTGHGYTTLDFSTQTLLLDAQTGTVLADLETFTVTRDGQPFRSEDFNFWGVTFTPDVRSFFATLSTAGKHYLIKGDIATRTASIIHDNVECPSLSPDARRVAYKKRFTIGNRIVWQLHILDLQSGTETALAEKRSIDDQLEWLSEHWVLYSVPSDDGSGASTDVWMSPADASAPPALFLRNAYSPATARTLQPSTMSRS